MNSVKKEFASLKIKLKIGFICVLPFIIAFVMFAGSAHPKSGEAYGLPIIFWLPVCVLPFLIYIAFALKFWRCPTCKNYLGKNYNPIFCPKCGQQLQWVITMQLCTPLRGRTPKTWLRHWAPHIAGVRVYQAMRLIVVISILLSFEVQAWECLDKHKGMETSFDEHVQLASEIYLGRVTNA